MPLLLITAFLITARLYASAGFGGGSRPNALLVLAAHLACARAGSVLAAVSSQLRFPVSCVGGTAPVCGGKSSGLCRFMHCPITIPAMITFERASDFPDRPDWISAGETDPQPILGNDILWDMEGCCSCAIVHPPATLLHPDTCLPYQTCSGSGFGRETSPSRAHTGTLRPETTSCPTPRPDAFDEYARRRNSIAPPNELGKVPGPPPD